MSWKEFVWKLAHDYRPLIIAYFSGHVIGWHQKQPNWMQRKKG